MRVMSCRLCFLILVVCAIDLDAQVIRGTVIDSTAGRIAAAEITVIQGDSARTTETDDKGNFTLMLAAGSFRLRARALGFETVEVDSLSVDRFQRLTVMITMRVDPLDVAPVVVLSRRAQSRLGREGFEWRKERARKTGIGRVLDHGDLTQTSAIYLTDVLRRQPFLARSFSIPYRSPMVSFVGRPGWGASARTNGTEGMQTEPLASAGPRGQTTFSSQPYGGGLGACDQGYSIYLDGSPTRLTLDEIDGMPLHDMAGVEIYRKSYEVPGEFGGGRWGCGVIAIWTKR